MATKGIQVCCLDVGQGMCTFVEVYDTDNKLIRTLLFDLGSSKNSKRAGPATVGYLAKQIKARKPVDGYLDAVFISHKDSDHVSLIPDLLAAVPNAKIGKVFYGGRHSWYKKSKSNVLDSLGKRCTSRKTDVQGFPVGETNYSGGKFQNHLWQSDGVTVYLLIVNTPYKGELKGTLEKNISAKPDGDQANSKSLVCVVWFREDGFCISGDATYPTLTQINTILDTKKLSDIRMMLLPHHGSRKTTFGLPSTAAKISEASMETVTTFGKKIQARTLIANADTKHSHPSMETIAVFQKYTDTFSAWWADPVLKNHNHYLSAYLDFLLAAGGPKSGQYKSFQNDWNVYSTLYCNPSKIGYFEYVSNGGVFRKLPPPRDPKLFPEGMSWFYWVPKENKPVTLTGVDSGRVVAIEAGPLIGPPPRKLEQATSPSDPVHVPPRAPLSGLDTIPMPRIKPIG